MKTFSVIIFLFLTLGLLFPNPGSSKIITINSPDKRVLFSILIDKENASFSVSFDSQPVILNSRLHFILDGSDISRQVSLKTVERYKVDETYPWMGVHSSAINRCNGAKLELHNKNTGENFTLEARAFDSGIGFRFLVPGNGKSRIPDEATCFNLPVGSTVWHHNLRGHYEAEYSRNKISNIPDSTWLAPPVTFSLPESGIYASVTEANLVNYAGMAFQSDGKGHLVLRLGHSHPASYPFELRYGAEEAKRLSVPAAINGPVVTPWRVVLIGAGLNQLVNSDIIQNLSDPPDPAIFPDGIKTGWIKPGRAVWKYLDGGGENNLETMKKFCTQAAELGVEYNVVEGFWRNWSDEQILDLTSYARNIGVWIFLWEHSKNLRRPGARDSFFTRCNRLGVAGVKIDFLDHEAKEVIDLYQELLKGAAKNKLLVNFHGANKPTGENRTWPNEITREGVRGMETRSLADRATHDVTLPFTRMLAGNADYTPMHFGERKKNTTWTHQVASTIIFNSLLLTFAASPETILASPCREMVESIPSAWDETVVLPPSEIGEIAVFARRKGETWFLAVMNGITPRSIEIKTDFLPQGKYKISSLCDQPENPESVQKNEFTVSGGEIINIRLSSGGGYVARITK